MPKRKISKVLLILLLSIMLSGCMGKENHTHIVLTTGLGRNEIFRIGDSKATIPEIMIYLTTMQGQYQDVYGEEIWEVTTQDNITLEDNVKDIVLARMSQVKAMVLLADHNKIVLNEEELAQVELMAETYMESLNKETIAALKVEKEVILSLYQEYALANKVYYDIVKDINPEISDDEARVITIEQIIVKTYDIDANGNKVAYDETKKIEARKLAEQALHEARQNVDFKQLIATYSDVQTGMIAFHKGEMEDAFEQAAFNLGQNEISDIIETDEGYHIIRCISTFDQMKTDANKITIVKEKREEVFTKEYEEFTSGLVKMLNENAWEKVKMIKDDSVYTVEFFEIYRKFFAQAD